MRSFIDGNGGSNSNVLIQEELGATVSPKPAHRSDGISTNQSSLEQET